MVEKFKIIVSKTDIEQFDKMLGQNKERYDIVSVRGVKYVVETFNKTVSIYPRKYATKNSYKDGICMSSNSSSMGELKYQCLKFLIEDNPFQDINVEYEIVDKPKLTYDLLSSVQAKSHYESVKYPSCCRHCSSLISCKRLMPIGKEAWVNYMYCDKCNTFLAVISPDLQASEGQGSYTVEEYSYDFVKNNFALEQ